MKNPIIGLITDYGLVDSYVAQLKGAVLSVQSRAILVDLNHLVQPFNIRHGSFLLAQSVDSFPAGSIFVVVIDPGVGTERRSIVLQTTKGHLFVGPDNGVFTDVIRHYGTKSVHLISNQELHRDGIPSNTFHGRDIYGPVAGHLSNGIKLKKVGPKVEDPCLLPDLPVFVEKDVIRGEVIHIDHFGNIVTNLREVHLVGLFAGRTIEVQLGRKKRTMPFASTYGPPGDQLLALLNSSGHFEIALPQGNAAENLKLSIGTKVRVSW